MNHFLTGLDRKQRPAQIVRATSLPTLPHRPRLATSVSSRRGRDRKRLARTRRKVPSDSRFYVVHHQQRVVDSVERLRQRGQRRFARQTTFDGTGEFFYRIEHQRRRVRSTDGQLEQHGVVHAVSVSEIVAKKFDTFPARYNIFCYTFLVWFSYLRTKLLIIS